MTPAREDTRMKRHRIRELKPGDLVENARTNSIGTVTAVFLRGCRVRNEHGHTAYWVMANCLACSQNRYEELQVLSLISRAARRPVRQIGFNDPPATVGLGTDNPGRTISFVAALDSLYGISLPFGSISRRKSVRSIINLVLKERGKRAKKAA